MGLIDFIKDAGERLAEAGEDAVLAGKIRERIDKHELKIKDLQVTVQGDKVILEGTPESHEDREKALLVAGNVKGISRVSDDMAVAEDVLESRYHSVASGDTLSSISKKFYGDPNRYRKIFEANRPMLQDPDSIYPGQLLRIPK